jgi:hypothetical protein
MFNITKVNRELRSSGFLSWYREEKTDYICNGYFIIKTDLTKEENRKILSLLVERFGAIPEMGKELAFSYNRITILNSKPNWLEVIEGRKKEVIEDTKLTETSNNGEMRVFKGKDYIYINMKYFEMIKDSSLVEFEGGKQIEPITANYEDDLLLILPVRVFNYNKYLIKEMEV